MLPDEQASPEQIAIWRAMSGEQRLRLAERLYWTARSVKTAGVRSQHPDWTDEKVNAEVRRIFIHARTTQFLSFVHSICSMLALPGEQMDWITLDECVTRAEGLQ